MRLEKYTMDLLCAEEHLESVIDRIPLGKRELAIDECIYRLKLKKLAKLEVPEIKFSLSKEVY